MCGIVLSIPLDSLVSRLSDFSSRGGGGVRCGNVGCCGLRDGCFGSMQWRISPTSGERNRGIGISPMLLYGYNSILIDYDDNRQGLGPLLLLIPLAVIRPPVGFVDKGVSWGGIVR